MITHRIIKFKPKIIIPRRQNNFGPKDHAIKTTQDLLEYLKDLPKVGAYVTLHHNKEITRPGMVNYVMGVAEQYADDLFTFSGNVEAHQVLNLNTQMSPWIRWVNAKEYRELSDAERQVYIDADVSDYIKSTLESV